MLLPPTSIRFSYSSQSKIHPTLTTFIDRFLVTAEAYSIQTVLLFNKIDTYNAEEYAQVQALKKTYKAIGYQCIEVSSTKGTHLNQVKELMKAKVSMFSGHSGSGQNNHDQRH